MDGARCLYLWAGSIGPGRSAISGLEEYETELLFSFKAQRSRVNAVAQPGRPRSVRKNMPQVPAAPRARNLNPPHSQAHVFMLRHGLRIRGQQKAWPSASRVELSPAKKQQRAAPRAVVVSALVILCQRAGERALRPFLAQHTVLLRLEPRAPLSIRANNFIGRLAHAISRTPRKLDAANPPNSSMFCMDAVLPRFSTTGLRRWGGCSLFPVFRSPPPAQSPPARPWAAARPRPLSAPVAPRHLRSDTRHTPRSWPQNPSGPSGIRSF